MTQSFPAPFGPYTLFRELGRGGFATVYLARDEARERDVALKVLDPRLGGDPSFRRRFEREFELTAKLDHPHIVKAFDLSEIDDRLCIAMALVAGSDLRMRIRDAGALPVPVALRIAGEVASALDYAHEKGIVHRDVKSANVLLDAGGRSFLTDFGLMRAVEGASFMTAYTQSDDFLGTAEYLSPEQADGGDATARSDLYSFGVVIYEMLTGQVPFRAERPVAVARMQADTSVPDPVSLRPDLPLGMALEMLRALAKRPDDRPASAGAYVAALWAALTEEEQALAETKRRLLQMQESVRTQARARIEALRQQREEAERARGVAEAQTAQLEALAGETERLIEELAREEAEARRAALEADRARRDADHSLSAAEGRVEQAGRRLDELGTAAPGLTATALAQQDMVFVPGGAFLMGDDQRKLPAFWIDRTPVTNAQYAEFVAATVHRRPAHWNGPTPPGQIAHHPVVNVSWHDAVAYAEWRGVRLPTEEEWEKAARGTDGRTYPWGNEQPTPKLCNFGNNEKGTTPVGKYSPQGDSPYGCVDMAGNVWEWTQSGYDATGKVVRGGSWSIVAYGVRSAFRNWDDPVTADDLVGFRCARSS